MEDDGYSLVSAEEYVIFRLQPMILEFQDTARKLGTATKIIQTIVALLTGLTTLAAAVKQYNLQPLVPVLVGLVSLLNAFFGFENIQVRLVNVQRALETLQNQETWWQSLSLTERREFENKERLVAVTEEQSDADISAWKKSSKPVQKSNDNNDAAQVETENKHHDAGRKSSQRQMPPRA